MPSVDWLCRAVMAGLEEEAKGFPAGAVGISRAPTVYCALGDGRRTGGAGQQVMLSFFAYGETESNALANLETVVGALSSALRKVSARIAAREVDALYR